MKKLIIINEDKTISVVEPTGEIEIDVLADQLNATVYEKDLPNTPFLKWENDTVVEDVERKQLHESEQSKKDAKTQKEKELNALQVSLNNVSYDAHMEAMGNMGIVTAVAGFEMWKAWASLSPENLAVYNAVFKQTIEWKGATNDKHVVQIESVAETAKKAMGAKAEILFKY